MLHAKLIDTYWWREDVLRRAKKVTGSRWWRFGAATMNNFLVEDLVLALEREIHARKSLLKELDEKE